VILDLLGNYVYRFEQLGGTLAMPLKTSGKYHLGGKVCVFGEQALIVAIRNLKPIFDLLDCPILFLFPIQGTCTMDAATTMNTALA
jgi:hypothetical protein